MNTDDKVRLFTCSRDVVLPKAVFVVGRRAASLVAPSETLRTRARTHTHARVRVFVVYASSLRSLNCGGGG